MTSTLLSRKDLDLLLVDRLRVDELTKRQRLAPDARPDSASRKDR